MDERLTVRHSAGGFSLLELMLVLGVSGTLVGVAVPSITGARQRLELNGAIHEVATAVQSARLRALSSGRTMRVRFNCPVARQYRVVEVVGDASIDGASNRCDGGAYPYPDQDGSNRPNLDGPVQVMRGGVAFSQATDVDISPTGRITPAAGAAPVVISVNKSNATRTLTLSAVGRISFD